MIDKITAYICRNSELKENDAEKIQYALTAIFNDLSKFIVLLILFSLIGKERYFIFSSIILLSIRGFSGGVHFDTTIKCFAFTALIFIITSIIAPFYFRTFYVVYYIVAALSLLIITIKSPSPSVNRPIRSEKRRQRLKVLATLFTAAWVVVLFYCVKDVELFNCGLSAIVLQAIQLLIPKR